MAQIMTGISDVYDQHNILFNNIFPGFYHIFNGTLKYQSSVHYYNSYLTVFHYFSY